MNRAALAAWIIITFWYKYIYSYIKAVPIKFLRWSIDHDVSTNASNRECSWMSKLAKWSVSDRSWSIMIVIGHSLIKQSLKNKIISTGNRKNVDNCELRVQEDSNHYLLWSKLLIDLDLYIENLSFFNSRKKYFYDFSWIDRN